MAERLYNLRGVPDDELEEIRQLLTANKLTFYETPAGNWGISSPALWVKQAADVQRGRALIADYQLARAERARADWEQRRRDGEVEGLLGRVRREPLQALIYLAVIALVLYVSIKPFLLL